MGELVFKIKAEHVALYRKKSLLNRTVENRHSLFTCLGWISSRSLSVSPQQPGILTAALPRFQNYSWPDAFLKDTESRVLVCICE